MTDPAMEDVDAEDTYGYEPLRIERLEIENFKSYRGNHRIGPFKSFTAVIGPNGSGKSNLMDAISFVLGVRSGQLRGSLKELLYVNTSSKDPADAPKRGSVKLVLSSTSNQQIEFSRWLQPGAGSATVSVYKINEQQVTVDAYNRKLASYGILVKLRNFLVFQGDIEAVAQKSPMDLTKHFEQISGSEALAERYEECQKAKEAADSVVSLMFSKKKNVLQEKKAKREQKEEAERYLKTQQDLKDVKGQLLRFRLKCLQKDLETAQAAHEVEATDISALEHQHAEFEAKLKQKKAEQTDATKKRLLKEKERQKWSGQLDKKAPDLASLLEQVKQHKNRLELEKKTLANHANEEQKLQKKVIKLESDLQKVKADLQSVEEESQQGDGFNLSVAAVDEYNAIKTQVQSTTSTLQTELRRKEMELGNLKEELAQLADRTQASVADKEKLEAQLQTHKSDLAAKIASLAELKKTTGHKKTELNELQDQHRKCKARMDDLNAKLLDVQNKMDELKSERRESERDRRMTQAIEELKQNVPGVAGRMTELGRMPQQKYRLAITLAMQRDVDSVVVDTKQTSIECINYLKRTPGRPRLTFIPLDSVKVKPLDERLRHLSGTAKLAFDLVEFDKKYERAFMHALGNSLICDDAKEGERLAFHGAERQKVVTVDGVLYSKSGAITGGISHSIETSVSKWNEQAYQDLKKKHMQMLEDLGQLPNLENMAEKRSSMQQELNHLESKVVMLTEDISRQELRVPIIEKNLTKASQDASRQLTREAPLKTEISALEGQIEQIKRRVDEVADKMFAAFSRKMKIDSIREYEENALKTAQELRKRRDALQDQETKIATQLKFDNDKLKKTQGTIGLKEKKIEESSKKLEELHQQVAGLEQQKQKLEQDIAQARLDIQAFREEEKQLEEGLLELKQQEKEYLGVLSKHQRQLAALEHQLSHACTAVWGILEEATIAQINLRSVVSGDEAGPSEAATEEQFTSGSADDYSGLPALQQANKALEQLATINFESLPRAHQSAKSKAERDKVAGHYQAQMQELQEALEKNAPNLKAVEQFAAIQEKEKKQAAELEQARAVAHQATAAFDKVRRLRHDKFMLAFDDVSKSIDEIYKQLTTSRVHPMGGQAFLSLENPDEPFLYGIKYTAMPPTKRFRDMESLSGGEKTMAAVALLFAIHRFRPSPFFVLDEVDAALDATNVARLAHYIRNNTRNSDGQQFQSIVISLKDNFFEKADALVGVSRDAVKGCSNTFSLDLERYGPPTAVDA